MKRKRGDPKQEDLREYIPWEIKLREPKCELKETKQLKLTDIYPDWDIRISEPKAEVTKKHRQCILEEFFANQKMEIPLKVSGRHMSFFPDMTGKAWFRHTGTSVVTSGFLKDATSCGWRVVQYADGFLLEKGKVKFIVSLNESKASAVIRRLHD